MGNVGARHDPAGPRSRPLDRREAWRRVGLLAIGALVVTSAGGAVAAPVARRYSGTVRAVDLHAGIVVVEELGRGGQPERHEIQVGADTRIVSSWRLRPHEMRGMGAYGEVLVSPADLLVGDYVTIESREEGGRGVAIRITIVEIPGRSGPAP